MALGTLSVSVCRLRVCGTIVLPMLIHAIFSLWPQHAVWVLCRASMRLQEKHSIWPMESGAMLTLLLVRIQKRHLRREYSRHHIQQRSSSITPVTIHISLSRKLRMVALCCRTTPRMVPGPIFCVMVQQWMPATILL